MIGIIFTIIIITIMIAALIRDKRNNPHDYRESGLAPLIVCGIVCCLIIGIVVDFGVSLFTSIPEIEKISELESSHKLIALQDKTTTEGSYFLGCGTSEDSEYYVFYAGNEYGYKRYKIDAYSSAKAVYINYLESDDDTPHVDYYQRIKIKRMGERPKIWLSIIDYIKYNKYNQGDEIKRIVGVIGSSDDYRIEIFVPEGTIKENYEIDLE